MRRPVWHKALKVTLVLILSILLGSVLLRWLDPNRHIQFITAKAGAILGGEVSASAIHWGFDQGLWLQVEQLDVRDATLIPADISAQRLYARAALKPLLRGRLVIEQVAIDAPDITYRLLPTAASATPAAPDSDDRSADFHPPISLQALALRQGRLIIEDGVSRSGYILAHRFDNIDIIVGELATGQPLNFALTADLLPMQPRPAKSPSIASDKRAKGVAGTLRLTGHLRGINERFDWQDPWLDSDLEINQMPLAGLGAYLGHTDTRQAQQLDGQVTARLKYQGDFSTRSESHAQMDLGSIRYYNPRLWPQAMPGSALRINAHLTQKGSDLHLNKVIVDAEGLNLNGTANLRQGRNTAVLANGALTATLPLAELARFIPWPLLGDAAAPVRRMLDNNPGLATLEQLELPDIAIGQPISATKLLARTRARLTLSKLLVPIGPRRPPLENIEGQFQLADNALRGDHIKATFSTLRLPDAHFSARDLLGKPQIEAVINGPLTRAQMSRSRRQELLSLMGLEQLDLRGGVSLRAHYDHARPQSWRADGYLDIDKLQLLTLSPATQVSARGQIKLRREHKLDLLIPGIDGRINRSPFAVSGQLFSLLEPDLLVDLKVMLKGLELAKLAPWFDAITPFPLTPYRLAGRLSTDVDLFYLHSEPGKLSARGPVTLYGGYLHLPAELAPIGQYLPRDGLRLEQIKANLFLAPQFYQLNRLSLRANDQLIRLRGELQNLERPKITLSAYSPELDLDRLLPAIQPPAASPSKVEVDHASGVAPSKSSHKRGQRWLPKRLRHARADVSADVTSGSYRGDAFSNLALTTNYRHGDIKQATMKIKLAGGDARAQGSASLLNLNAIPFKLDYQFNKIDLARLTRLFSKDGKETASGLLNSKASLRGNTRDLKTSLRGELHMRTGPGKIPNRSVAANTLFSILSLVNIQGIISGDLGAGLALDGMPYDHLAASAQFTSRGIQLEPIHLITPAFSTRAVGNVNLSRKAIDMDAVITLLGTIDTLLSFVPLVGRAASDLTKVYLKLSGNLTDPTVRVQPAEGLTTGIESMLEMPLGILQDEEQQPMK